MTTIQIVLGGLGGLAIAVVGLRYLAGIDLLENRQEAATSVEVREQAESSIAELATFSVAEESVEGSASASATPTTSTVPPEATPAPITSIAVERDGDAVPMKSSRTDVAEIEDSSAPAATENAKNPPRLPVPHADRQTLVRKEIEELFPQAVSTSAAERRSLAAELARVAADTAKSEEQFVLVRYAAELAADSGDLATATKLIDELAAQFEFDPLVAKQASLVRWAASSNSISEAEMETALGIAVSLAAEARRQGHYDRTVQITQSIVEASRKPAGAKHRKRAADLLAESQRLHNDSLEYRSAREVLATRPDDPEAALTVGRWLCFEMGAWNAGLPLLVKGKDQAVAKAANLDLAGPHDGEEMIHCADAWYEVGMAREQDRAMLVRAAKWYREAQPTATGAAKVLVDKRLAELTAILPEPLFTAAQDVRILRGETKWTGIGVTIRSFRGGMPAYARLELEITTPADRDTFSARNSWIGYEDHETSRGSVTVQGSRTPEGVVWTFPESGLKTQGVLVNDVLTAQFANNDHQGVSWYVPMAHAKECAVAMQGTYRVTQPGEPPRLLELHPDGRAARADTPGVNGAWLAAKDRVFIVWADGTRDLLVKRGDRLATSSFAKGASVDQPPARTGLAERAN